MFFFLKSIVLKISKVPHLIFYKCLQQKSSQIYLPVPWVTLTSIRPLLATSCVHTIKSTTSSHYLPSNLPLLVITLYLKSTTDDCYLCTTSNLRLTTLTCVPPLKSTTDDCYLCTPLKSTANDCYLCTSPQIYH